MSKFYNYLNAALLGAIVLGGLAACQDEDFDVSEATLKAKAYDNAFIKQFGKPDPDQSWDFFTQSLESLKKGGSAFSAITRALSEEDWDVIDEEGGVWGVRYRDLDNQPAYIKANNYAEVAKYSKLLPEQKNNYTLGQTQYKLQSTGSGNFTISAIWYGGAFETTARYNFNFYIHFEVEPHDEYVIDEVSGEVVTDEETGEPITQRVNSKRVRLFSGVRSSFGNPKLSADVHLDAGKQFWFELVYYNVNNTDEVHHFYSIGTTIEKYDYSKYSARYNASEGFPYSYSTFAHKSSDYYHIYNGPSQLLYNETDYGDTGITRYMVIGFEDAWEDLNYLDFDYNDIVLYIDGDLPIPEAKRFFAEDLQAFDWDFNDVVVDVEYKRNVLRAVGGSLPVYVVFRRSFTGEYIHIKQYDENGNKIADDYELHELIYDQNVKNGNRPDKALKDKNGRYRPINVNAEDGLTLNPAVIMQWDKPLSLDELKNVGANGRPDVIFYVNNTNGSFQHVNIDPDLTNISYNDPNNRNECPSVVMGTVQTRWMKEFQLITLGYPTFYLGNNPSSDQDLENIWCNFNVKTEYLYTPPLKDDN